MPVKIFLKQQTAQKYLRHPKNICTCQVALLVLLVVGGAVAGAVYFKYHKRWAACRGSLIRYSHSTSSDLILLQKLIFNSCFELKDDNEKRAELLALLCKSTLLWQCPKLAGGPGQGQQLVPALPGQHRGHGQAAQEGVPHLRARRAISTYQQTLHFTLCRDGAISEQKIFDGSTDIYYLL